MLRFHIGELDCSGAVGSCDFGGSIGAVMAEDDDVFLIFRVFGFQSRINGIRNNIFFVTGADDNGEIMVFLRLRILLRLEERNEREKQLHEEDTEDEDDGEDIDPPDDVCKNFHNEEATNVAQSFQPCRRGQDLVSVQTRLRQTRHREH